MRSVSASGSDAPRIGVAGEAREDLGPQQPVFVQLAGQLDEVQGDVRREEARVARLREQRMQAVAELVKERARVRRAEERRAAGRRFDEIADVDDQRPDWRVQPLGDPQLHCPRAGAFARAGEVVAVEHAQMFAPSVLGLPDLHVRAGLGTSSRGTNVTPWALAWGIWSCSGSLRAWVSQWRCS